MADDENGRVENRPIDDPNPVPGQDGSAGDVDADGVDDETDN